MFNWFKSKLHIARYRETAKKGKNYRDTDRTIGYRYSPHNKHPKYPELPKSTNCETKHEYSGYSKNGWNITNNIGNSNSPYSITCSVDFFIHEEQKHYNRLRNYVFEPLAGINLEYLNLQYEQNDVIPTYGNVPYYEYYNEAVLHMQKDKANLHLILDDVRNLLDHFNTEATQANREINERIEAKISEAGLDKNNPVQLQDINEINILTRRFLRLQIFKADDVYQAAHVFDNNMHAEGLKPTIRDTIIYIMKDDEIVEKMASVKGIENALKVIFKDINNIARKVVMSIKDKSYETRTNCCPTYWTLIKRFV